MRPEETRDQAVERLLRRSFEIGGSAEVSLNCVDAETFAAWSDGALDAFQLKTVEAHLADCTRCQAMAAVMTRATPNAPVEMPWWRRSLRSSWLVPLTAGAAAVALWSVVPSPPAQVAQETTAASEPTAERPSPESKASSQPALTDRFEVSADAKAKGVDSSTARGASSSSSLRANRQRVDVAAGEPKPVDEKRENLATRDQPRRAAQEETADRLAAAASPPPPPPPPTSPIPTTSPVSATVPLPAPGPPPPARPASAAPDVSRFRETAAGALMKQDASTREIVSPSSAVRWRLGAGGVIDRTDDGGKTWRRLASGVTADLIAGASSSPSICWVVGRDSTVLRSTDGVTWVRVNIPEMADLVRVEAVDASTAVVTASDGRRFQTSDGGRTWIK